MAIEFHTKFIALTPACAVTVACGAQESDHSWDPPDNIGAGDGGVTGGSSSGGTASGGSAGKSGGSSSGGASEGIASDGTDGSGGSGGGWTFPAGVTRPRIIASARARVSRNATLTRAGKSKGK